MLNVIMSTCTHGHAEHVAYAEYEHMHSHDVAREHVAHAEHEHMHSHDVARDHVAHAEHEHMHSHANMLVLAPTRALPAAPAHPQTSGDLRRDGGPHQPRLQPTAQTGTYEPTLTQSSNLNQPGTQAALLCCWSFRRVAGLAISLLLHACCTTRRSLLCP